MTTKILLLFLLCGSSLFAQYKRELFITNWAPYNGCIDVKEQIFIRDAKAAIAYNQINGKNCSVVSSTWICPWTGKVLVDPSKLDVGYSVPLKWAYDHGAKDWDAAKRSSFANSLADANQMQIVDINIIKTRGELGPDRWMPEEGKCNYVRKFDFVVKKWALRYTLDEQKAIGGLIKQYCFP